ncbi:MAG: hypothetical protein ABIV10_07650 [Gemmatimonadaceae bacterium]
MIFVLFVAAAMITLTWVLGWWGILVVALVIGVVFHEHGGGGWRVAAAASVAWGALLAADGVVGPLGHVATMLGGVTGVPAAGILVLTLVFPAALAWSAATIAAESRRIVGSRAS